jgi:hypothetical protein
MRDIIKTATFWELVTWTCLVLIGWTIAGSIANYMT